MKTSFPIKILCLFFFACSLSVEVFAADGDILYENYFNSSSDLSNDWDQTNNSAVALSSATFNTSPTAIAMRSGPQTLTLKSSAAINAAVTAADLSVWVRRGDDSFSEDPDSGEDFRVQYLNDSSNWITLEQFAGNGTPGEIFDRTYTLPASALHGGLRLRFSNIDGNFFSDYWHLDDVVVTDRTPAPFDLVGKWHLDEANWTGTANQVEDVSGNNLHGFSVARSSTHPSTAFSTPAISDPDGTCGYGIFDGPNRGFVQIDDPGTNSILDFQTEVTVAVWIHPHAIPGSDLRTIVSKDTNFEFHINSAGQIFWWWGGGSRELTTTGTALQANQTDGSGNPVWHHVAITYKSGTQKIYIDGVERASRATTGNLSLNNLPLLIGTDWAYDGRTFDGLIDQVSLYSNALTQSQVQTVMAETHTCSNVVLDHYHISYDGGVTASDSTGITCEPSEVTITAHDSSHGVSVSPGSGTSINLATSTGVGYWSAADVGSIVDAGSGNGVYTFAGNDAVTLQFNHTALAVNPSPVNININSGTGNPTEISTEDPNIQFFETGFRFIDSVDNTVITNQISAQQSGTFYLQAIRTDTDTGSCVNIFPNASAVDIDISAECNNPSSCAGVQVSLTNNSNTSNISTNNDNGSSGSSAYSTFSSFLFGADSKAAFTFNYPDVGGISLHARYRIRNEDGSLSSEYMYGSSNSFIVSPASFVVTAIDDGVTSNPGTTSSGTGFRAAGDAFRVTVEARNALGNRTPNYGNETTPEGLELNFSALVFPVGGNNGALGNVTSFTGTGTAGEFINNSLTWNEAGSFTGFVSVADGNYLGAGNVVGPVTGTIGRFYPADFDLVSSAVANSCAAGSFSYLSEPALDVSYSIEAHNRAGNVIGNYDNADLLYPAATISYHGENSNDGVDLASRLNILNSTWDDGVFTVTENNGVMNRAVDGSGNIVPDGPFASLILAVSLNDIDSANFSSLDFKASDNNNCVVDVDCDSKLLSGLLDLRFARLHAFDGHGPESAAIPMRWQMEYWNSTQFVINTDDQCTQLPLSLVSFVGATTTIDTVNDNISVNIGGITSVFDFSDPLGSDNCLSASAIEFCDGHAGINYGAPGSIVSYAMDFDLSTLGFLQGDWDQDGSYDDSTHPRVNIRFEHYRGHDRVIYWREQLK